MAEKKITLEEIRAKANQMDLLKMQGDEKLLGDLEKFMFRFSSVDAQDLIDGINAIIGADPA